MDKLIKVFGERNTATRAVLAMIDAASGVQGVANDEIPDEELEPYDAMLARVEAAYRGPWKRIYREAIKDVRSEFLGPLGAWKHSAPSYNSAYRDEGVGVIFMVRNPYSWITSLHRRPYHNMGKRVGALPQFLALPWMTVGRDNLDRILPSPMLLWSLKIKAYQVFEAAASEENVRCAWIRFEDFVVDPRRTLAAALTDLAQAKLRLRVVNRSTKPFGPLPADRRAYYAQERWREELCAASVEAINDFVDWEIAEEFGYDCLRPDDFPAWVPSNGKRRPAATARGRIGIFDNKARTDDFGRVVDGGI